MDEVKFAEIMKEAFIEVTDTYNKSTLRRTLSSRAALKHLSSYNKNMKKILSNPNLSKAQFFELNNMVTELKSDYTNRVADKERKKSKLNSKKAKIKLNTPVVSEIAKKVIKKSPQFTTASLIDSLGGFTGEKKSTSTSMTPYDAVKAQGNKVNFNLRGYQLFENAAYNAKIHGVSKTIEELDIGVKEGKIDASEADNMKKTLTKSNVRAKLNQFGQTEEVTQFNKPEYQKAFKTFLRGTYNTFTKIGKVINKVAPKVFVPLQVMDMKNQYNEVMEKGTIMGSPLPGTAKPQTYKTGGKIKRKPYAMGGKVYSNSTRKPKFK